MLFCAFADVFGKPREGVHRLRIPGLDVAAVDFVGLFVGAGILSLLFPWPLRLWLVLPIFCILLMAAMLCHLLFGVNTRINEAVFGHVKCPFKWCCDRKECSKSLQHRAGHGAAVVG